MQILPSRRSPATPLLPVLFVVGWCLTPLGAQAEPAPAEEAPRPKYEKVTEARLQAAYADARAAVEKVLGARLDELPPLRIAEVAAVAEVITAENLPMVRLREPDAATAEALAKQIGDQLAPLVYAKYAWTTRTFLVVAITWERTARILQRPALTNDATLRAVMVHELCHALDDRKFDFGKRLLEADTADAITAFNAVIEGHAQLRARRVCAQSGWSEGFATLTDSIGALPAGTAGGEATRFLLRAKAAALMTAYVDGERFAAAVIEARPDTGERDLFESPPKDPETILAPRWYLDPSSRPELLYDLEPAIDAFVAGFDAAVWSGTRSNVTGKQLATGLTMLPQEDIDAVIGSLRAVRIVQLAPTAAPQSKIAILCAMEFASEDAARHWIAMSAKVSDHKDATMDKGTVRITGSKTTELTRDTLRGFLQEKTMKNGRLAFDVASIDAQQGRIVLETIYSGEPPSAEDHVALVEQLLTKVRLRK